VPPPAPWDGACSTAVRCTGWSPWPADGAGVKLDDGPELARLAGTFNIRFGSGTAGEEAVWLDDTEVTSAIRTEEAGNDASKVAALPMVRAPSERHAALRDPRIWLADRADMGTVVFPGGGG